MTDVTSTTTGKRYLQCTVLAVSALLTVMNSDRVEAIEYTWPVITGAEVEVYNETLRYYHLTWALVNVRDDTIAPNTRAVDVYKAKTGFSTLTLFSSVRNRKTLPDGTIVGGGPHGQIDTGTVTTFEQYAARVSTYFPTNYTTIMQTNSYLGSECIGLITSGQASAAWAPWTDLMTRNWDGGVGAMGGCIGTPPVNEWCALVSPAVEIAYGTMSVADAVGAQKSSNVSVSCTTGMKYTLRLRGADTISLSNGMHAELEADGRPLNSPLNGVAGMNNVILSSTLNGEPVRTGEFKGEGVLFVSYP